MCTTTELSQNITARMTKPAVPSSGRRRHGKSGSGRRKTESVKGSRAITSEKWTPGGQILHSKTRVVKFDRTRVISSKLTDRKKIVDHLRSNKNIRKAKRTRSRTHGGDRETGPITNHDRRRRRGIRRSSRREDTSIRGGVVGSTRVSDPLRASRRGQPHGAEGLSQDGRIPRRRAGLRGWKPGRCEGTGAGEQGGGV